MKEEEKKLENKKEKHKEVNDKSEFPDLSELKTVQSETEKYVKGKGGRKRKKEKRIDITHELFRNREEDMDEWFL